MTKFTVALVHNVAGNVPDWVRQRLASEMIELLAESDYVSLHCSLTETTRHLIGEAQLCRMKKTAVLINTSRGAVVDEAALMRALREGRIAGAGLDVMEGMVRQAMTSWSRTARVGRGITTEQTRHLRRWPRKLLP